MQKGWLRPYRLDSVAYYIVLKFVDKQRKNLFTSYKLFKPRIQLKDGLYLFVTLTERLLIIISLQVQMLKIRCNTQGPVELNRLENYIHTYTNFICVSGS